MAENIKKKFIREKPHVSIGGIGHVDHGKTTLIAAITKYSAEKGQAKFKDYGEIDKAPEERNRGITISTSHIEFETAKRHYTWIDCPGHADYVKNMITGAAQMDGAIVVVAAGDSVMDQTKEHLLLAKQVGIKYVIVYINKADVSDPETMELTEMDVRENLAKYEFDKDNTPVIKGSALCALEGRKPEIGKESIAKLLEAVDSYIPTPQRDLNSPFKLYIEDVFAIPKIGTVVTGRVEKGVLTVGEEIEISGLGMKNIKTIATGLEMHNKELDQAQAGDDIGIKLRGVKKEEVVRGQLVSKASKDSKIKAYNKFSAKAYILSKAEGGRKTNLWSGYRPQFFFRTADVTGTIRLLKADNTEDTEKEIQPGNTAEFTVELVKPLVIEELEKFIIREGGLTVGQGKVLKTIE